MQIRPDNVKAVSANKKGLEREFSLNKSVQRAMFIAVSVALIVATAWMGMGSWMGVHAAGQGWSNASASVLRDEFSHFKVETEALADLEMADPDLVGAVADSADIAVLQRKGRLRDLKGGSSRLGAGLRAWILSTISQSGFYWHGRDLYYASMRGIPQDKGGGSVILARQVMQSFVENATRATTQEAVLFSKEGPSYSTLSGRDGKVLFPEFPEELLARMRGLRRGEILHGISTAICRGGYGGFEDYMAGPDNLFEAGSESFPIFYGMSRIDGPGGEPIGYALSLEPTQVTTGGVEKGIAGSMALLVVLCLLSIVYARRTTRRFLEPLSGEIRRIRRLSMILGQGHEEEDTGSVATGELEVLRRAVSRMEEAIVRDRESARLLDEERARSVFAMKMASLGEMASGVAHEINTPLAVITARAEQAAELLQEEPLDRKAVLKLCQGISGTGLRIAKIIKGLRNFARDGSGEEFREVPLQELLEEALSLCTERFRSNGVALVLPAIPAGLEISCRPTEIVQVLLNLFNNAFDAVQGLAEKWVHVGLQQDDAGLKITVSDSGPGVDASILQKIFQPFFSTKAPGSGTGLGLSISRGIAQSHGGSLEIEAGLKNTRFALSFPLSSLHAMPQEAAHG